MGSRTLAFLATAALIIVTPGPDLALIMRNALARGRRAGVATSLGAASGICVHATAAVLGLSAVLAVSATAFTIVKLTGAAYLVFLGLQSACDWDTRRARRRHGTTSPAEPTPAGVRAAFGQGLVSDVLNPKAALFFLTLLPQFLVPGQPVLAHTAALSAMFVAMMVTWDLVFILLVVQAGRLLQRPAIKRTLERMTGIVLVGLGVQVATEHR
jgi:threonine/homoserine/homoserine lactone efflux protein